MRVTFIGGGNMGFAIAQALISENIINTKDLTIIEHSSARREFIQSKVDLKLKDFADEDLSETNVLFLAIKPQVAETACKELRTYLSENTLVISVMAGVSVSRLEELLGGHKLIVRCMPNMPAQLGQGITAYFLTAKAAEKEQVVSRLLSATGLSIKVDEEYLVDAATAVSGSGPAYVYYFIEHFVTAAVKIGFDEETACTLVKQTIIGALANWEASKKDPAALREEVTSKGGTTEAALNVLTMSGVGKGIEAAVEAAFKRAKELSDAG